MNITLYSTGCPQCNVLKAKLDEHEIDYIIEDNVDLMLEKGFTSAPMLEVDGDVMNLQRAFQWLDNR